MNTQEKINAVRKLLDEIEVDVGLSRQVVPQAPWAGAEHWPRAADTSLTLDKVLDRCDVVCAGVDQDISGQFFALGVVGRLKDNSGWVSWSYNWASREFITTGALGSPALVDFFIKDGDLTVTDGGEMVWELVYTIRSIQKAGLLTHVGLDPAGSSRVYNELIAAGVEPDKIVSVSRGWKMGGAVKTVERMLSEGNLIHPGHSVMHWVVRNAMVEQRANALTVTKNANPVIDVSPLIALFSAVGLLSNATS